MTLHHPLLLLALVPLGAVMWWATRSLRELSTMQRENERDRAEMERTIADVYRRFPHVRDGSGHDG